MKRNYRIRISYDGTRFYGWEHQPDKEMTIQGKLETVLYKLSGEQIEVLGAGRTDAGVHALEMVANFRLDTELSEAALKDYMNRYLPEDICVNELTIAGDRFHARYNATGKTYRYMCYVGDGKPVFERRFVHVPEKVPDIGLMKAAAEYLKGTHDFASFCSNPRMKKSTVRTVDRIDIVKKGPWLTFWYHGNGFLQHMVRIMTGTLLEVGEGKRTPESMTDLLEAKTRALAGVTAPAKGLCLIKVDYD